MDLREISLQISSSLEQYRHELIQTIEDNEAAKIVHTEEYKAASAQGDRSENAELIKAIEDLTATNEAIANARSALNNIESNVKNHANYKPTGRVVVYSTVLIQNCATGEEQYFKLFPAGVSDLTRHIVDVKSRIGQACHLKMKGDIIVVEESLLRKPIRWLIKDIY